MTSAIIRGVIRVHISQMIGFRRRSALPVAPTATPSSGVPRLLPNVRPVYASPLNCKTSHQFSGKWICVSRLNPFVTSTCELSAHQKFRGIHTKEHASQATQPISPRSATLRPKHTLGRLIRLRVRRVRGEVPRSALRTADEPPTDDGAPRRGDLDLRASSSTSASSRKRPGSLQFDQGREGNVFQLSANCAYRLGWGIVVALDASGARPAAFREHVNFDPGLAMA